MEVKYSTIKNVNERLRSFYCGKLQKGPFRLVTVRAQAG